VVSTSPPTPTTSPTLEPTLPDVTHPPRTR
jgi:hypothetical protein